MFAMGGKLTLASTVSLLQCWCDIIHHQSRIEEVEGMIEQAKDFASGAARMSELTDMIVDQIRKLAELHEQGILTDEEFTAKKTELLSRL